MTESMFLLNHNIVNSLVSTPTSLSPLLKTQNPGRELPIGQPLVTFLPQAEADCGRHPCGTASQHEKGYPQGLSPTRSRCVVRKRDWV